MIEDIIAITIFLVVSVALSLLAHKCIKNTLIASIVAGLVSSLTFQFIAYIEAGFLDPFYIIGFLFGWAYAFVIALFIGYLIRLKNDNE